MDFRAVIAATIACTATASLAPAHADNLDTADLSAATKVPANTKVSFYVGLDRPEKKAQRALRAVSDPDGPRYRDHYSRAAVAREFGATKATIAAARRSVAKYGLELRVDPTGVLARVSGTAGQMRRWVGQPLQIASQAVPGGEVQVVYTQAKMPAGAREGIREFFGGDYLTTYQATALSSANPRYSGEQSGTPKNSCVPAASEVLNAYTYSVNELRTAYGLDELPSGPTLGKATRVAILAQGQGFSDEALQAVQECFGLSPATFRRIDAPGLQGPLPVGGEGDLDVQIVQQVLPAGAKVDVVQASGFDSRDFLIWSTVFGLDRRPDVVTTSYGMCEPLMKKSRGPVVLKLTESVFRRLGLVGTSLFAASGDRGSSDCVNNATGKGNTRLAVNFPASSPLVTAVGGTRIELTAGNRRANEVVWFGPALRSPDIPPDNTGGGGGYSILFDRPWWQPKSMARSSARVVPDIAAHASPVPGWPVVTALPSGELALQPIGGTSAATPFVAATMGVLAANERIAGRASFGLVQPLLYDLARSRPSTFYDVQTGNNDVFGKGCCQAHAGYDAASGLGAIQFDKLAKRIPAGG